jgi:hypothetical protein
VKYESDFFNNVAAIAVVLMFTKVVAHHVRKVPRDRTGTWWLAAFHVVAVGAAAVAVGAALVVTEHESPSIAGHVFAWLGLGVTALILILDIAVDECTHAHRKRDEPT